MLRRRRARAARTPSRQRAERPARSATSRRSRRCRNAEFSDDVAEQIDQLLALIYALLALAVIVSLFGIVNTLVLSITERTRELGMLRAIGTSRRQVRADDPLGGGDHEPDRRHPRRRARHRAWRSWSAATVDDLTLSIPVGHRPAPCCVLAAVAGVLAAVLPARRAARLDVLRGASRTSSASSAGEQRRRRGARSRPRRAAGGRRSAPSGDEDHERRRRTASQQRGRGAARPGASAPG